MKLFTASFLTETSDLNSVPLSDKDWRIETPSETQSGASMQREVQQLFAELGRDQGWQVVESICATAFPPGGRTTKSTYETIRDQILGDLKAAMPVDVVLLNLHGAAMAHDYDDCEGDLLAHIRTVVGPDVPIGVELDPHCHMTEAMTTNANIIVLYKTFLHTDIKERARELFELTVRTVAGDIHPMMHLVDCKMTDCFDEADEPMKSFLQTVYQREKEKGILSISPVHGFGMANTPDMGSKMLVVTDNDKELARRTAEELGRQFFECRGQMASVGKSDLVIKLAEAKARSEKGEKGIQLTEFSDLSGCGFATDGTELISAMLEQGMTDMAAGLIWDPLAVSLCHQVGEGTEFMIRIGGKASAYSGIPLDLKVIVERLYKGYVADTWVGDILLGDVAVVRSGAMQLILVSHRAMAGGPKLFKELGVDPSDKDYLVFKYAHDAENPISLFGSSLDYKNWSFDRIDRPKYPWDKTISFEHQKSH